MTVYIVIQAGREKEEEPSIRGVFSSPEKARDFKAKIGRAWTEEWNVRE